MGQVYRGLHIELGREVAIKLLQPKLATDQKAMERLKREARAAAQLGNPHIVDVYDLGVSTDGRPYVVMKLVPGRTLKEIIDEEAPLALPRLMRLLRQLSEALKDAHEAGVIHRDLKPENVIVSGRDARERVTILDFGIARRIEDVDKRLTVEGEMIGTAGYMAPEQALAKTIDARADQFALGVMVYEMLCGAFPYDGESALRIIAAQLTGLPKDIHPLVNPEVIPTALCDAVMRALSKDPEDRFEDVIFFANACAEAVARGDDAQPTMAVTAVTGPKTQSEGHVGRGLAIGVIAVLSVVIVLWLNQSSSTDDADPPSPSSTAVVSIETPQDPVQTPPNKTPVAAITRTESNAPTTNTVPDVPPADPAKTSAAQQTQTQPPKARPKTQPKTQPKAEKPRLRKPKPVRSKPKPATIEPVGAKTVAPKKPAVAPKPVGETPPPSDTTAHAAVAPATPKAAPPPAVEPATPPPPPPKPPALVFGEIEVSGGASKRKIRKVVERAYPDIRKCVDGLAGLQAGDRARVQFAIDADGFFDEWSARGKGPLGQCAKKALRRLKRLGRRPDTGGIKVSVLLRMDPR